jgi:hypothetical protein
MRLRRLLLLGAALVGVWLFATGARGNIDIVAADAKQRLDATSIGRLEIASLRAENARLQELHNLRLENSQLVGEEKMLRAQLRVQQQQQLLLAPGAAPKPQAAENLIVVANTIPRSGGEKYLLRTLDSFASQVPPTGVTVFVLNLRPGKHEVFAEAQELYKGDGRFIFHEAEPIRTEPELPPEQLEREEKEEGMMKEEVDLDGPPVPGRRNRQQTRDVSMLTRLVVSIFGVGGSGGTPLSGAPVMLIEDDFVLCEGAMSKLLGLVAPGALLSPDWTAIRVSYGLCGIIMQMRDLPAWSDYILAQQSYRPVDILAYYWFARESSQRQPAALTHFGKDRDNFNYRHNLLNHIGKVSTYPGRPARQFAGCSDVLVVWSLHKHERFDIEGCPGWMVSPCPAGKLGAELQAQAAVAMAGTATRAGGGLAAAPFMVATAPRIAGETIPHTAPWEGNQAVEVEVAAPGST